MYFDLRGNFPLRLIDGMTTVFVIYDWTTNAILVEPIENAKDKTLIRVFNKKLAYLTKRDFKPKFNILDNVARKALQEYFEKEDVKIQLVESHNHRVNASKRAVQTFKNLLLLGLSMCDNEFPLALWSHLVRQCKAACNLLRTLQAHPKLSVYHVLKGAHDFNKVP